MNQIYKIYYDFLETIPICSIVFCVEENKIDFTNNNLKQLLGYENDSLIGSSILSIIDKKQTNIFRQEFGSFDDSITSSVEFRFLSKKNEVYYFNIKANKTILKDKKCIVLFLSNITEIKQSKKSYIDLFKQYTNTKDAIDQATIIAVTDSNGIITGVNDHFCKVSGYSKEELIGKTHKIINSGYHSKDFFKELWNTISSGKIWRGEIKNKNKKGNYYWVNTTIVPTLDENNKPLEYVAIRHEITKQKEAEKQVSRLLERVDGMVFTIYDYPENSNYFISKGAKELTGYESEHFYNDNQFYDKIVHPEDVSMMKTILDQAIKNKKTFEIEYRIKHKNKGWIYVLEKGKGVWNHNDELVMIDGIIVDITQTVNKRNEQAEKDRLFDLIYHNSGDVISFHNPDGKFFFASPSIEKITDYKPDELINVNAFNFHHKEDLINIIQPAINKAIQTKDSVLIEYRFRKKDNTFIWVESSIKVIEKNGVIQHIQSISREINKRKRLELQLKKAEFLSKTGSWEQDLKTKEFFWSEEVYRILELPTNEKGIETSQNFLNQIHPNDRKLLKKMHENILKNHTSYEIIYRIEKSNPTKYIKENCELVLDDNGTPIKLIGSIQDISEMYLLQQELIELNNDLERKVETRTKELLDQVKRNQLLEKEKVITETNYQVLFDYVPVGIAFVSPTEDKKDFFIRDYNKKGLEIDRKVKEKIIGKKLTEVYPEIHKTELFRSLLNMKDVGFGKKITTTYYQDNYIEGWRESAFYKLDSDNIIIVFNDVTEDALLRNSLKESVKEKEFLLDEIHHRVKNNLQVVIGLMNMQQNALGDEYTKQVLKESERRVRAMSLIHELIYQKKNYSQIKIVDYINNLYYYLSESFQHKNIFFIPKIDNIYFSIPTSTNLGILLTEIITNCYKYAFPDHISNPEIYLSIQKINQNEYELIIRDNGIGFDKNNIKPNSLGMNLINGMAKQLKTEIDCFTSSKGTTYNMNFKDSNLN